MCDAISSAGMSHSTSATLAVPKRAISSRRTISGRNRWSSYELIGAAGLSLVVEQDPEPTSSTVDESATETVAVQRPVFDLDTSDDSAHQPVPDSLATEDSADRERRRSYNEILGIIFCMKLFQTSNLEIIQYCRTSFGLQ